VILLDTNALLWLEQGHRRARPLAGRERIYLSPASLLEVQMLIESGRMRPFAGITPANVASDPRWIVDDIPSSRWFTAAIDVGWTRDPFDRLLVAHARVRGWKLATSDENMLEHLTASECLAL
jgi:PIN domain nuclease of toxin-antitoxin system